MSFLLTIFQFAILVQVNQVKYRRNQIYYSSGSGLSERDVFFLGVFVCVSLQCAILECEA